MLMVMLIQFCDITLGSVERQMVAGTVATKENPQTGEKRRKVRFPEKKRLMIPT